MFPDLSALIGEFRGDCEWLGELRSAFRGAELDDAGIRAALCRPYWPNPVDRPVCELVQPRESVLIVVSDHTRKTAANRILPVLTQELIRGGCRVEDLRLIFASGIHRHPTPEEIRSILGADMHDLFSGRILFHDPDDAANLVSVGQTRRGHDVRVNRHVVETERLILLGAATYHYHAGFGGGRKSLVPGLAARATIAYNHSMTLDPVHNRIRAGVEIGALDGNAVSEEMFEGARLCEPDFIVNTVLTPEGKLVGVFAGDLDLAHRAACRTIEEVDRIDLDRRADVVIATTGHATNWIQSHKALFNAHRAAAANGWVVLLAPCGEGIGNERFRHWISRPTLADIYAGLRQHPEVLGQTALSTRIRGERTILVTDMPEQDRRDLGIRTCPDARSAVSVALELARAGGVTRPSVYGMPDALSLVPFVGRAAACV